MKKALVTGAAGFAGSHLTELLIKKNVSVSALAHPNHPTENLKPFLSKIKILNADLTKAAHVRKMLKEDYDYIFHLAAFSSPPQSFENPQDTLKNNIFSQLNILETLKSKKSKSKVLIVGSSDEYGNVKKEYLPVNEETPLSPTSPYAVSKVAQDLMGYQFFLNYGINVVRVRPFNHIGPRQSKHFVVSSFASQIADAEKENKGVIEVGNLNSYRDFTDVRDMVKAYLMALEKGKIGEVYNIGSGKSYKISDILKKLLSFSKVKIKVVEDKMRVRKTDIQKIYCDSSKFEKDTGWHPTIDIDKTLFDTIEYERALRN